jgi:hypothetical protein
VHARCACLPAQACTAWTLKPAAEPPGYPPGAGPTANSLQGGYWGTMPEAFRHSISSCVAAACRSGCQAALGVPAGDAAAAAAVFWKVYRLGCTCADWDAPVSALFTVVSPVVNTEAAILLSLASSLACCVCWSVSRGEVSSKIRYGASTHTCVVTHQRATSTGQMTWQGCCRCC